MLGAVAALGLSGCQLGARQGDGRLDFSVLTPAAGRDVSQVTLGDTNEPSSLDPIVSYNFDDDEILDNMCEALFRLNPNLTVSPLLATSAHRPNPTTWVYEIRHGVRFWNGQPLTAADVAYSLGRNLVTANGSYFASYYQRVKSIQATGRYQVTVHFTRPDSLWNQVLVVSGSAVIEKSWALARKGQIGTPSGRLMCTGPYEWGKWTRGSSISLVRNPHYWDPARSGKARRVVFKFISDSAAQTNALISGGVDGMVLLDPSGIPRLQESHGHLYFGRNLFLDYLIPTTVHSAMSELDVRRALSLVINRPAIADNIYYGAAVPMRTYVTPTVWGSNPAVRRIFSREWAATKVYATQHLALAKKLFDAAGAPKAPITLAFPTGGVEQQIVQAVQSWAQKIGMNIQLKGYSPAAIQNLYYEPKAQAKAGIDLIWGPFEVDTTDPMDLYLTFAPADHSVYDYSQFYTPTITHDLDQAWTTFNPVRRARYTAAAERAVMKDLPWIPLVSPDMLVYQRDGLTGITTSFSLYWSAWANRIGRP